MTEIGKEAKYHFHCITCKITFHLDYMPRICIWCKTPANDRDTKISNFIDIEQMKVIAKQIHDVQRAIPKV